jgi:hypothetical protein
MVQAVFEGGHDAEISSTSTQSPEQIRVFVRTGFDQPAIGCENVGRQQIVASQTESTHQKAVAPS